MMPGGAGEARIRLDASGLESLFAQIGDRLNLTGKLGKRIASIMRADALRQFQAGGEPNWPPLAPATIERKARLGYPRLNRRGLIPQRLVQRGNFGPSNILMMTGALLSSWSDEQDPHHVEELEPRSVSIGSDLDYAGVHQNGYQGPLFGNPKIQGTIPARPIRITNDAKEKITRAIEEAALSEEP
jgi:phage gpG-like protein